MEINEIRSLIVSDLEALNRVIQEQLTSNVALINQLGFYIVQSGGKRVRPMLVILSANMFGCQSDQHHVLAATIEFIHTATLLHDDVVDESQMRRGKPTANNEFGNAATVLTGDFLYSRAFQMMVGINEMRVMQILSDATNVIAEGEVMQLMNCNNPDISVEDYYQTIYCKTAKLFEAATSLGAIAGGQPESIQQHLGKYGAHLGTAFQLVDDALDYHSNAHTLGKNIGDDLAEGKPTLPLLHAMEHGSSDQRSVIAEAVKSGGLDKLNEILATIEETGSIQYTFDRAQIEATNAIKCLDSLSDSPYKEALAGLARYSAKRDF